ncbi:MAG TPA: biopolymer transporter ExbD [Nitrospiria bacterium]|nr:biopolymer transporter ExbD [Nitrospiria bacterium]
MPLIDREKTKRRRTETDEAIHIVALWNLMLILIPFLLLSSAFSETTVLSIQIPSASPFSPPLKSPNISDPAPKEPVRLMVTSGGFRLEQGSVKPIVLPMKSGSYDYAGLRAALFEMKKRNPDEDNITLSGASGVHYEVIVKTMDECRLARFPGISIGEDPAETVQ